VGQLSNPDDAMILPDGRLMIPDVRKLSTAVRPTECLGTFGTAGHDRRPHHPPPAYFGNYRVFPMRDGRYLVQRSTGTG
jgi:hypothetical protein